MVYTRAPYCWPLRVIPCCCRWSARLRRCRWVKVPLQYPRDDVRRDAWLNRYDRRPTLRWQIHSSTGRYLCAWTPLRHCRRSETVWRVRSAVYRRCGYSTTSACDGATELRQGQCTGCADSLGAHESPGALAMGMHSVTVKRLGALCGVWK